MMTNEINSRLGKEFIDELKKKSRKLNSSFIACVTGPTGSGKSVYSIALGEATSINKMVVDRIYFSQKDLLKDVIDKKILKCETVILEEAGTSMNSRDALKSQNKIYSKLFQIIRVENFNLILNLPIYIALDKQMKSLIHVHFTMQSIDRKHNTSTAEVMVNQVNEREGKIYKKAPMFHVKNFFGQIKMTTLTLPKPDDDLLKLYEEKKIQFNRDQYKIWYDQLEDLDTGNKEIKQEIDLNKIAEQVKDNPKYLNSRGRLDEYAIINDFHVSKHKAFLIKSMVQRPLFTTQPTKLHI